VPNIPHSIRERSYLAHNRSYIVTGRYRFYAGVTVEQGTISLGYTQLILQQQFRPPVYRVIAQFKVEQYDDHLQISLTIH
jgi:hypothetical protein